MIEGWISLILAVCFIVMAVLVVACVQLALSITVYKYKAWRLMRKSGAAEERFGRSRTYNDELIRVMNDEFAETQEGDG